MTTRIFLFGLLFIFSVVFTLLEHSFKSFSRVSLAGLLEDMKGRRIQQFDFVNRFDRVLGALTTFSFFLQITFFMYTYVFLEIFIADRIHRIALLIAGFTLFFPIFLGNIAYFFRERLIRRLIILYRLPWLFYFPVLQALSVFNRRENDIKNGNGDDLSEKELEIFIEEGTKEGVIETEDREMITSILEFGDTRVKEIMTPRIDMIYVPIDVSLEQLIRRIDEKKKSRYPVVSGRVDNIEGIILSKDVFRYIHRSDFSIRNILRKPFFVPETMRILELLKEMQKSRLKFAIVVDEFGGVSGLVTMEDIIEEIVGEIQDEYDEEIEQIIREKDHLIVNGDTDMIELAETLDIKIDEDEDYQTVAGFISYKLGRIPAISDRVQIAGHILQVMEMEKNRIKKVRITTLNAH